MRDTAGSTRTAGIRRGTGVVAVVVLLAMAATGCGDGAAVAPAAFAVGEGAPLAAGYRRAFAVSGGEAVLGQATTPVEAWGGGCRQLFTGGRSRTAALLQWPCGPNEQVFAVTGDVWARYGEAGERAPTRYGFPVGHRGAWGGGETQGFGRHGGLEHFFMQRPGQPLHVLSSPILEHYLSFDDREVRMGFPTSGLSSTPDGRRCQQFERAAITADGEGAPLVFDVVPVTEADRTSTCR